MILLSKVDKMEYFFTFTITTTLITLDPNRPVVVTNCYTTNPIQVAENDQRSVRVFCNEVVNQQIPQGMVLVNYGDPQLLNAQHGIRPFADDYILNHYYLDNQVQWFIRFVRPTYLHPGHPGRTHFAFMINVVVRQ